MSLEVKVDRALIRRSSRSVRHLLVTLEAPLAAPRERRMPVNVSFVIDRSGSMGGGKLEQACDAVVHALDRLDAGDRFSVVAYDDAVSVAVEPTYATPAARPAARAKVLALRTGGSTNLSGGWLKGCELLAERLREEAVARCFLLTDGQANAGIVDHAELAGHAAALRQRGIVTSTFDVGADFDEHLLGAMAQHD